MSNRDVFKKGDAENLQDFAKTASERQLLLEDRHEHVDTDGDPDLSLHRVLGGAVEGLDPQIVLDPFEEQLVFQQAVIRVGVVESSAG